MQILKNSALIRIFSVFLAAAITAAACTPSGITAQAEIKIDKPVQTAYLRDGSQKEILFYIEYSGGDSIDLSTICSDNELVSGSISCYEPVNMDSLYLGIIPKNAGTADISFDDFSGRSYTVTAEVLPYENPLKSLTVTNVNNGKNLAKKVDRSCEYSKALTFSKKTAAPVMKVEAAEGWRLVSISARAELKERSRYLYLRNINTRSETEKFDTVGKGTYIYFEICCRNIKNGSCQRVSIGKYIS